MMLLLATILLSVDAVITNGISTSHEVDLEMWYITVGDDFSGNNLPDRIIMKLPVEDQFVSLNLTKEEENVEVLPVKVAKRKPKDKNGHYSMYTDGSNEVSFSMAVDSEGSVLYGTFTLNGKVYTLLPSSDLTSDYVVTNNITINRTEYVVAKEIINSDFKDDDVDPKERKGASVLTKLEGEINSRLFPKDQKRNLTVEIYLVLDYSIFVKWYRLRNNDTQETIRHILYYYLNILNGVKQRYENIDTPEFRLSAALAGFYIAVNEESSPFPDSLKHIGKYPVTNYVLDNFFFWANQQKFPKHDVVALITDARQSNVNGMGFVGTACTDVGLSLTRDNGPFQTADTLTHEIGHNLGASHDGVENDCVQSRSYIMTASRKISSYLVEGNEYLFSNCSMKYFKEYIKKLDDNETNCLADVPQSDNSLQNKRLKYPGQIYSLDEQCSMVYGEGSHFCGGARREKDMCLGISCYEPDYNLCDPLHSLRPADGSSCGNKKWCIQGRCVYSEDAKEFKDYCMYGNHKNYEVECSDMINGSNYKCYLESFRNECCQSCEDIKRDVKGCEFGDSNPFICTPMFDPEDCHIYPYNERCCETCNNPEKLKVQPEAWHE